MHFRVLFTALLAISIAKSTPTALPVDSKSLRDVSACPAQWKSHVSELNALKVGSGDAYESFCKNPSAETAQPLCAYIMSNKEERSILSDVLGIVRGVLDKLLGTTFYTDKCQGAQHVKKDEHSDHTMACSGDFDAAGSDFVNSLDAYCKKSNNQTKKIMCKALVAVARDLDIDLSAVARICGGQSVSSGGGKTTLGGAKARLRGPQHSTTA